MVYFSVIESGSVEASNIMYTFHNNIAISTIMQSAHIYTPEIIGAAQHMHVLQ